MSLAPYRVLIRAFAASALAVSSSIAEPRQDPPITATRPKPADRAGDPARIDKFLAASGARGGVLIAKDGKIVLAKGYGWANEAARTPITTRTVFDIGSVSKQFTAAAIVKLEEEGKLRVQDPITRFFPEVPSDKQSITIHQLLTHTAGIEHDVIADGARPARDEMVRQTLTSKLALTPGTRYKYSNAGYSLLAAIVELASGAPFERTLKDKLWWPAGMGRTGWVLSRQALGELAHGFDFSGDLGSPLGALDTDGPAWGRRGAGSVLSTLDDLYSWHLALEGNAILSEKSKRAVFTAHVPEDDRGASHYGYGWALFTTPRGTRLIAHDGSNGTFFANFLRYVDENVVILYFTNERNSVSRKIFQSIPEAYFGGELPPVVNAAAPGEPPDLGSLAGAYQLPGGERFELRICNGQLSTETAALGVAKNLTTFPPLEGPDRGRDLDGAMRPLVEAILRGELDKARGALAFEGSWDDEKAYWARTTKGWTERFGAFDLLEVLGSARSQDALTSYALLGFARGAVLLNFRWLDSGSCAIGTRNDLLPRSYRLTAETAREFYVFNHALRSATRVRFDVDERGVAEGLTIRRAEGNVRALRVRN